MNRNHRMSSGLLIVVLLFSIFIAGCKSGGNKAPKEDLTVEVPKDNTAVYEDINNKSELTSKDKSQRNIFRKLLDFIKSIIRHKFLYVFKVHFRILE